jgi:hypothetical protein
MILKFQIIFFAEAFQINKSLKNNTSNLKALLIGVSFDLEKKNYFPSEENIEKIYNTLVLKGFSAKKILNPDFKTIISEVSIFNKNLNSNDIVFFYYSGLAVESSGLNYILSSDMKINTKDFIEKNWINLNKLLEIFKNSSAKSGLLSFEVTYPYKIDKEKKIFRGLSQINFAERYLLLFSDQPYNRVLFERHGVSVFSQHIADQMLSCNKLSALNIINNIIIMVKKDTLNKQIPWSNAFILTKDFIFKPVKKSNSSLDKVYSISAENKKSVLVNKKIKSLVKKKPVPQTSIYIKQLETIEKRKDIYNGYASIFYALNKKLPLNSNFIECDFKNSDSYSGSIKNGLFHGKAKYVHSDGRIFKGSYYNGFREGFGFLYFKKKHNYDRAQIYKGYFKNDLYHGKGLMKYSNYDTYNGEFVKGFRQGFGVYHFFNGMKYKGEWNTDLASGGVLINKKGQKWHYKQDIKGKWIEIKKDP